MGIKNRADVDASDAGGASVLSITARQGHAAMVAQLVSRRASIASKDKNKWQPLHYAASAGHVSVVQMLAQFRADYMAETPHGQAIQIAADDGHADVVRLLTKYRANAMRENRQHPDDEECQKKTNDCVGGAESGDSPQS